MAKTTGGDPFEGVHLEMVGVVVGFRWLYIRSETGNEKTRLEHVTGCRSGLALSQGAKGKAF